MKIENIGCSLCPAWSREAMERMIERLGRSEAAHRFAWLLDGTSEEAEKLIDAFLAGDWVDDRGVKGGHYFWGDL